MQVFSGYYKDSIKCLESSSGGAVSALAEKVLENKGVVLGARYTSDFYGVEYCCVTKKEELKQLKGSKYCNASKAGVFSSIERYLVEGRMVLFVGLGCDVAGIKKYAINKGLVTDKLYTIDLLCHGPTVKDVHKKYILELESKYKSKIVDFTIKYKKKGWTPFYIKAIFENGKEFMTPFKTSDYGKAFYNVAKPACTQCQFKGDNHKGDLCCGDFWGVKKGMESWNKNGVSIMIVQTPKGNELLNLLDSSFYIHEESPEFVFKGNPMYFESRKPIYPYKTFLFDLNENGLHLAVKKIPKKNIISIIIVRIKKVLKCINIWTV